MVMKDAVANHACVTSGRCGAGYPHSLLYPEKNIRQFLHSYKRSGRMHRSGIRTRAVRLIEKMLPSRQQRQCLPQPDGAS